MHGKSSKPPRMFRWDAVDTWPDLGGGQNVIRTFEMAIWHNRRTTRTELEKVFCRWTYYNLLSTKIFSGSLTGVGQSPPSHPYVSASGGINIFHSSKPSRHRLLVASVCSVRLRGWTIIVKFRVILLQDDNILNSIIMFDTVLWTDVGRTASRLNFNTN